MLPSVFFLARLNEHISYLTKVKSALTNAEGDFSGTDYHLCKLGKWLYGEGRDQSIAISKEMLATFEQLFEPHKAFHRETEKALLARSKGNYEEQELAFTQMHILSNNLVSLLLKMDSIALHNKSRAGRD